MRNYRNYGYIPPIIDEEKDYVLGAERSAPFEIVLDAGDWRDGLPAGEEQRKSGFETYSCTNFGWLNLVETYMKKIFFIDENYCERFLAVVSGQTREGNDPQKPAEALRKMGIVQERLLPFIEGMKWETYFYPNPMSPYYLSEALKWLDDYEFKHEYIFTKTTLSEKQRLLVQALKRSPVGVSVYAWEKNTEGFYIKPLGVKDNHWTTLVYAEQGKYWLIYDSYSENGDFLKKLDWNYDFGVAKGFYLRKKTEAEKQSERKQLSIMEKIVELLTKLATFLGFPPDKDPIIVPDSEPVLPPPAPNLPITPPNLPITPVIQSLYDFGDLISAKHSARVIMDDYNLSWDAKNLLCAVIMTESHFDPNAIHENKKDGVIISTDYGICQINDYYWIGRGKYFASKEEVLNHPEKGIRFMIEQYKKGKLNYWSAYNNLSYKKYL